MKKYIVFLFIIIQLVQCTPVLAESRKEPIITPQIRENIADKTGYPFNETELDELYIQLSSDVNLLPLQKIVFKNPLDSIDVMHRTASLLNQYGENILFSLINGSVLIQQHVGQIRGDSWEFESISDEELTTQLKRLNNMVIPENENEWDNDISGLPEILKIVIYEFMQTLIQVYPIMNYAQNRLVSIISNTSLEKISSTFPNLDGMETHQLSELVSSKLLHYIGQAAVPLHLFLSNLMDNQHGFTRLFLEKPIQIKTALGDIFVYGKQNNNHTFEHSPLLIIDLGGDDTYVGTYAQASQSHPFSLLIDMEGNDRYETNSKTISPGSSIFGYSSIMDLGAGNDHFEGSERCLGYSMAGVSLIFNASGNTHYKAKSHCLGASDYGIAQLIDTGGDDVYDAFHSSMGYAGNGGFSLLLDTAGNDAYITHATPAIYPSAQLPEQNFSGSQGFGRGYFGPYSDGTSIVGGIGMLIDRQGNDVYRSSVLAQGSGYAHGLGLLADFEGSDEYLSSWYAMGSAAHQACGFLIDASGNDRYHASHYMTAGAAVDLALGFFADLGGDDRYQAKNVSFGYGIDNAIGCFFEGKGRDEYTLSNGVGLGSSRNDRAASLRGIWPTFGIFIDQFGQDIYHSQEFNNNTHWPETSFSEEFPPLLQIGIDMQ